MAINMDKKAANSGDRMKHALTLEILTRTTSWDSVTVSETHAGAGEFSAGNQQESKQYIRELHEIVSKLGEAIPRTGQPFAGHAYLRLLKEWWKAEANQGIYPGGAKQAWTYLNMFRPQEEFDLRLTENGPDEFKRLDEVFQDSKVQPRERSFFEELEWLAGPDNLVLVVDPFRCVESFGSDSALNIEKGGIDHGIVNGFLTLCENKKASILHFWWPKRAQPGGSDLDKALIASHKAARHLFHQWKKSGKTLATREFTDKSNHASVLIGVGDGARLVDEIPGKSDWQISWLKPFLAESRARIEAPQDVRPSE